MHSTKRKDLKSGKLYYCSRNIKPSDSLIIWKHGPQYSFNDLNTDDDQVDKIWMNKYNIFCFLEAIQDTDPELQNTYWYKILTKNGKIGYFVLDDDEVSVLRIKFFEVAK